MEPQAWDRIQQVYYSALPLPPAQRNDFVARACNFDPTLTREICGLLEAEQSATGFLEAPVFELALRIISTEAHPPPAIEAESEDSLIGSTIDGRYVVERRLAIGGMACVYLARNLRLIQKPVVVKVLLDESLRNERIVRKFQQESEALSRVDHPGVVNILDAGELPDKKPYLVEQFIDGISLREAITPRPEGLDFERAAMIIKGIGSALSAVHRNGVYHRDLKPENIMLQRLSPAEEQVKIVDFGIAKVRASLAGPSTESGAGAMGTVNYMSPEQLRGDRVGAESDVYSFAVVAYEMLTGRRPFVADTVTQLTEMQRRGVRVKPSDLQPRVPPGVDAIILNGLAFEPKARSLGAGEFGERLSRALLADAPRLPARGRKPKTGRWLALAAAAVLLLTVVTATYWLVWRPWFGSTTNPRSSPHRTLAYSFTVQKMRDGKPYLDQFESSGEKTFETGDQFRLNVTSRQSGYLYVFSQGPPEQEAFTIIYPTPAKKEGSARLEQNEDLQTNWNTFTGETGNERLWIVWSATPVTALEIARHGAFKNDGAITEATAARSLRDFLSERSNPPPDTIKDAPKQRTTVRAGGDLLVKLVALEHR